MPWIENRVPSEYRELYFTSWEAKKIVEIPINDALRKDGILEGINENKIKKLKEKAIELNYKAKLREALILERLDGGCVLFIGFSDNKNLTTLPDKTSEITFLNIINIDNIRIDIQYNNTFTIENKVKFFIDEKEVHEDRLIVFRGLSPTTIKAVHQNDYFSNSVLMPLYQDIAWARNLRETASILAKKTSIPIFSVENALTVDQEKIQKLKDIVNNINNEQAIILDADNVKVHEFKTNFGAIPELINIQSKTLPAGSDIPITRFLGTSNTGLTTSSDGDLENYYNLLGEMLNTHIYFKEMSFYKKIYISIFGKDSELSKLKITYPPLWNLSEIEDENIKNKKIEKIIKTVESGLMSSNDAIVEINSNNVFITELSTDSSDSIEIEIEDRSQLNKKEEEKND